MTTLTVNLSAALQQELSPASPYPTGTMSAYAVYFITATSKGTYANGTEYDAGASIPVWTPLVLNGTAETSGGSATINLPFPVNGGKIYFLIQSNAPGSTDNLE